MYILFSLFPSPAINLSFQILIALILSVISVTIKIQSIYFILHYSFKRVHKIHKTQYGFTKLVTNGLFLLS